mmetsp:Transcript_62441/g.99278  ORF Transcript_62441/g.99278 Transcript_62441/m.99278 type:complete len:260 (+) Transcript_62441:47-826(+)
MTNTRFSHKTTTKTTIKPGLGASHIKPIRVSVINLLVAIHIVHIPSIISTTPRWRHIGIVVHGIIRCIASNASVILLLHTRHHQTLRHFLFLLLTMLLFVQIQRDFESGIIGICLRVIIFITVIIRFMFATIQHQRVDQQGADTQQTQTRHQRNQRSLKVELSDPAALHKGDVDAMSISYHSVRLVPLNALCHLVLRLLDAHHLHRILWVPVMRRIRIIIVDDHHQHDSSMTHSFVGFDTSTVALRVTEIAQISLRSVQ